MSGNQAVYQTNEPNECAQCVWLWKIGHTNITGKACSTAMLLQRHSSPEDIRESVGSHNPARTSSGSVFELNQWWIRMIFRREFSVPKVCCPSSNQATHACHNKVSVGFLGRQAFQLPMFAVTICFINPCLLGNLSLHSLPEAWGPWAPQYAPPVLRYACIMPIPSLQLQKKDPSHQWWIRMILRREFSVPKVCSVCLIPSNSCRRHSEVLTRFFGLWSPKKRFGLWHFSGPSAPFCHATKATKQWRIPAFQLPYQKLEVPESCSTLHQLIMVAWCLQKAKDRVVVCKIGRYWLWSRLSHIWDCCKSMKKCRDSACSLRGLEARLPAFRLPMFAISNSFPPFLLEFQASTPCQKLQVPENGSMLHQPCIIASCPSLRWSWSKIPVFFRREAEGLVTELSSAVIVSKIWITGQDIDCALSYDIWLLQVNEELSRLSF